MSVPIVAHVKWFHDFSFQDSPLGFGDAFSPLVIWLLLAGAVGIGALVVVDSKLANSSVYRSIAGWLEERKQNSLLVLRVGAGMTLLLSWQADAILVPELSIGSAWVGWLQFALALVLIFPRLSPVAGVGVIGLWLIALTDYGLFHMLDYLLFIGVGIYLIVATSTADRLRGLGLPALYVGLGFSLMWVGAEKIVYPEWGTGILELNQYLTLGFENDTFLLLVAVTEIVLGFLLVIGLLGRPLGLVITLVLFTTALTFGKTEVVGHTIIHAALIVFLLEGAGSFYKAPIDIHRRLGMRVAFGSVNFIIVTGALMAVYLVWARTVFESAAS